MKQTLQEGYLVLCHYNPYTGNVVTFANHPEILDLRAGQTLNSVLAPFFRTSSFTYNYFSPLALTRGLPLAGANLSASLTGDRAPPCSASEEEEEARASRS
jgi:hypothetical protein